MHADSTRIEVWHEIRLNTRTPASGMKEQRSMAKPKTAKSKAGMQPKQKINVLLLENIHAAAEEAFRASSLGRIEKQPGSPAEDSLIEMLSEVHVLGIRS